MITREKLDRARVRIELNDRLEVLKTSFLSKDDFELNAPLDKPFREFEHKYRHYLALRFYLLLTCFDILGADREFLSYHNWINSNENVNEFLSKRRVSGVIQKDAVELLDYYTSIYGMRKSFMRFINKILDDDCRKKLYDSVKIESSSNYISPLKDLNDITSTKEIDRFLLKVRNQYTHEGISLASGDDFFFRDFGPIFNKEGIRLYSWDLQHMEKRGSKYIAFRTRNWPEVLKDILQITVNRLEKDL